MKKQLTALVMGSLVVFSGQALAMKSNKQEVTNAEVLSNCEFLVAQITAEETAEIREALTKCSTLLGNAISETQKAEIPNKAPIISKLETAKTHIVDALSIAQSEIITIESNF